jgi:hypothetical protein
LSISFTSAGVAKDPAPLIGGMMADPSDHIPRAPIGHRLPPPSDLVVPKPAFDGTVGANLHGSDTDGNIDTLDREIMQENKEIDRTISEIFRGC